MRISLVQLNPLVGDLDANGCQLLAAARQAAEGGAGLLVASELVLWGYPPRDLLLVPSLLQRQERVLEQLVAELPAGMRLLLGIVEPLGAGGDSPLHNAVALVDGSGWRVVAAKRLLPSYDVFDERRYFRPGQRPGVVDLPWNGRHFRLGITVCEDLWADPQLLPQAPYSCDPIAELAPLGLDLMVNLSASPFALGKRQLRLGLARAAAHRLGCPVAYVNQVGGNDELVFDGNSFVVGQRGDLLLQLPVGVEATAQVDPGEPQQAVPLPAVADPDPQQELWDALVLGLRDYVRKCGFRSALLGLSGGIDSALVACVATAALGADRLRCLLMPSPYSSAGSIRDAEALARTLGISTATVPIAPLMDGFHQALTPVLGGDLQGVAAENLQSRIRGTLLMAVANQEGHLLLATGNKSELAVGYCTLYGDMNGGLSVIGDLYKTDVYRICHWLNSPAATPRRLAAGWAGDGELIPDAILRKPPSAELHPHQKDSDCLPEYTVLDPLLKRLVECHEAPEQLVAAGEPPALVNQVWTLMRRAEFKRRQAPPALKLSGRAFGTGWRMPIAAV